jgi:hypothetical protein
MIGFVRRCIYNRWFYGFLVLVCLIDVTAEFLDIINPGDNFGLDLISITSSALAAILAGIIFIDLCVRRRKL